MTTTALGDQYLRCRALHSHAWDDYSPIDGRAPDAGWGAALYWRCVRCGMVRRDVISLVDGHRLQSPQYTAPEGYRYGPDDLRPSADQLRLDLLRLRKPRAVSAQRRSQQRAAG